jgi:hypothetical protein
MRDGHDYQGRVRYARRTSMKDNLQIQSFTSMRDGHDYQGRVRYARRTSMKDNLQIQIFDLSIRTKYTSLYTYLARSYTVRLCSISN